MLELAGRLVSLQELVLLFNNPAQQFESRHLAVLAGLKNLRSLTLQASFHPETCSFTVLSRLPHLSALSVLPHEASTGLTDKHVASLTTLPGLASIEFPGHPRAFTGATLGALASLSRLARLAVTSNKPQAVEYTLALPALAGLRALARRSSSSSNASAKLPSLQLEIGVPDAAVAFALLRAVAGPGLAELRVAVREAADSASVQALVAAPGARDQLAGLDLEFRAAPTTDDVAALASCTALQRLHLTCKCPRPPATKLNLQPWLALKRLTHLHMHINPAWRAPLQPSMVAAMAAAWPDLQYLHLRLSPTDNAGHALDELTAFNCLKTLSLTWLGQTGPTAGGAAGGLTRRRSGSMDGNVFSMACLPPALEELSLTSISTVRLALPAAPKGCSPANCSATGSSASQPNVLLPSLRSLVLDGNFGLCDELLGTIVFQAPCMRSLTLVLTGRQTLSASGLSCVANGASQLTSLLLSDYREAPLCLSQACVESLSANGLGSNLRHLKLSTPDVVHAELQPAVFAGFRKLRRLDLLGCQDQAATALGPALPLACIKHSAEWAGDAAAVTNANSGAVDIANNGGVGVEGVAVAAAPLVAAA
eukprot:GHRR01005793.1.p1 GENE.GHRR01005793.1~~GHRR01005793.1.p1  ORF type:complete len:596 (+),score=233.50 GHRR01005793.1:1048-2835(+)